MGLEERRRRAARAQGDMRTQRVPDRLVLPRGFERALTSSRTRMQPLPAWPPARRRSASSTSAREFGEVNRFLPLAGQMPPQLVGVIGRIGARSLASPSAMMYIAVWAERRSGDTEPKV